MYDRDPSSEAMSSAASARLTNWLVPAGHSETIDCG
jgi:hypothetical protein